MIVGHRGIFIVFHFFFSIFPYLLIVLIVRRGGEPVASRLVVASFLFHAVTVLGSGVAGTRRGRRLDQIEMVLFIGKEYFIKKEKRTKQKLLLYCVKVGMLFHVKNVPLNCFDCFLFCLFVLAVLADANFPTSSVCRDGPKEVRADGHSIPALLDAVLQLMPLDTYCWSPVIHSFNF